MACLRHTSPIDCSPLSASRRILTICSAVKRFAFIRDLLGRDPYILTGPKNGGQVLSIDESEPFWIEGSLHIETATKKINRIRNRAEAFFEAALKYHKPAQVD